MKKNIMISIKLTLVMLLLCSVIYPLIIAGVGRFTPGNGRGEVLEQNGRKVGYALLGQKFTLDKYFWGRPSAVEYNAAGSASSNKGPFNPDYLDLVKKRIDSFIAHHPSLSKSEIPSEMITASGSGLDPDISPRGALIQVKRIALVRGMSEERIRKLVNDMVENSMFGPSTVNVLKLNLALDNLQ